MKKEELKTGDIVLYKAKDGSTEIDVKFEKDSVWLPQKKIAELFGVDVRTINDHIQSIYKSAELSENPTIRKNRIVQKE